MWRHMKSLSATLTQFATEERTMKDALLPLVGTELLLHVCAYIIGTCLCAPTQYLGPPHLEAGTPVFIF